MKKIILVFLMIIETFVQNENKIFYRKKLSDLQLSNKLQQLNLDSSIMPFDCVSLYPSAKTLMLSNVSKNRTGFVLTKNMNDELVSRINKNLSGLKKKQRIQQVIQEFSKVKRFYPQKMYW